MKSGLEALMTKPPCDDDEAHFCLCETDFQGFIRSAIEWGRPGLLLHEGKREEYWLYTYLLFSH